MHTLDQYPMDGLGIYDDLETCEQCSGYVWSNWTTKTVQPMRIDDALQAMIDQAYRQSADTAKQPSHTSAQPVSSTLAGDKGSHASTFPSAPPYPDSSEDVNMGASADKRSRGLPDSTLKPDGKSLKTSGTATPSPARHATSSSCEADTLMFDVSVEQETTSKPPVIRRNANDASQARLLVRQMHKRIPAWKLKLCAEALNARPIDHERIAEVTEIQFVNDELVDVAVQCLVDIARESESMTSSVGVASSAAAAPSQSEKESTETGLDRLLQSLTENLRVQTKLVNTALPVSQGRT